MKVECGGLPRLEDFGHHKNREIRKIRGMIFVLFHGCGCALYARRAAKVYGCTAPPVESQACKASKAPLSHPRM